MYFYDSDLVVLREHLNHPFALRVLACLLMALAAVGLRRMWLRVVVIVLAGLGASVALFGGWVALMFSSAEEVGFVDGPDPYRIRLQQSMAGLGPDAVMWLFGDSKRREQEFACGGSPSAFRQREGVPNQLRNPLPPATFPVGDTGIEPVTSSV